MPESGKRSSPSNAEDQNGQKDRDTRRNRRELTGKHSRVDVAPRNRLPRSQGRKELWLNRGDVVLSRDGKKYEVMRELGRGAFGAVFRVRDRAHRVLALKILKKTSSTEHEVMFSKMVSEDFIGHHHIVHIFNVFETTRGSMCILMEYLPLSLQEFISVHPPLELHYIRVITAGVLLGLYALKQIHLIHADIKPNNIMLLYVDRCIRAKIIDFGICELATDGPHVGLYIQAKPYRAPEVFLGYEVTHAIDIWSLGVCVAEMCIKGFLFDCDDTIMAFRSIVWQVGLDDTSYIEDAPNRDRFFEPAEDGCLVYSHGTIPGNAAKVDQILMRKLQRHRSLSHSERLEFVNFVVKLVCFDHRSRIPVEEALLQNFITMNENSVSRIHNARCYLHLSMLYRSCPTLYETTKQLERLNGGFTSAKRSRNPNHSSIESTLSESLTPQPVVKRLKAKHDKYTSDSNVCDYS